MHYHAVVHTGNPGRYHDSQTKDSWINSASSQLWSTLLSVSALHGCLTCDTQQKKVHLSHKVHS